MGKNSNIKKNKQLGMPHGTAMNRLRKMILFKLLQKADLNWCFRCGQKIEKIENLSIEHKNPWLDSDDPIKDFFDLDNIAFSHLSCNCSNARNFFKGKFKHPSASAYNRGCRCPKCTEIQKLRMRDYKARKKEELINERNNQF